MVLKKRTWIWVLAAGALLIAGVVGLGSLGRGAEAAQEAAQKPTALPPRSSQPAGVEADGVVYPKQTARLFWQTSGSVGAVYAQTGDSVTAGQELAALDSNSLSPDVILAQASLVQAQQALDNLKHSNLAQAQAQQAVEEAAAALEDSQSSVSSQTLALAEVNAAQKALDEAQRRLTILITPPSQAAIDQARADLQVAEYVLKQKQDQVDRYQKKLAKPERQYWLPFESHQFYRRILTNLLPALNRQQLRVEDERQRYQDLLDGPDPADLAVAQAEAAAAQAGLQDAQREYERRKNGPGAAETAALQAKLADAQREWERLKDGPTAADLSAAQAKVDAAKAALAMARLEAPFDGVVTLAQVRPGDQVNAGDLAFRLDDLSLLQVDLQVSEVDINQVKAGQPAVLTFDAIPAKEYHGLVAEVTAVGEEVEGVVNFTVTVALTDADELVKPGMTAEATVVVGD